VAAVLPLCVDVVVGAGLGRLEGIARNGIGRKLGYVWKKRVGKVVPKNAPTISSSHQPRKTPVGASEILRDSPSTP
jgi:hypothetical protein